jgi:hypothetical protein
MDAILFRIITIAPSCINKTLPVGFLEIGGGQRSPGSGVDAKIKVQTTETHAHKLQFLLP